MLAGYSVSPQNSRGRKYKEKEHPYRNIYQRDRDRIIHSAAFRRLEYKTQVFIIHEGDYYRTRLTHTLEVSQIARTIAKFLKLNEELTEAIALAHDLGHTPFGHAGENILNELLKEEGGFNHNIQGLRVVDFLERRYPEFVGLNLSWEVREGIVKHSYSPQMEEFLKEYPEFNTPEQPSLETQSVDVADEIAYDSHDLDDGLTSGLIEETSLSKLEFWRLIKKKIKKEYSNLNFSMLKYLIIKDLINYQVTDLVDNSSRILNKYRIKKLSDVRKHPERLINFSPHLETLRKPLRNFLFKKLYFHRRVLRMNEKSKRLISELFKIYYNNPWQIPDRFRREAGKNGLKRTICDYIAGMTDRFALDEYKKLFDPHERV